MVVWHHIGILTATAICGLFHVVNGQFNRGLCPKITQFFNTKGGLNGKGGCVDDCPVLCNGEQNRNACVKNCPDFLESLKTTITDGIVQTEYEETTTTDNSTSMPDNNKSESMTVFIVIIVISVLVIFLIPICIFLWKYKKACYQTVDDSRTAKGRIVAEESSNCDEISLNDIEQGNGVGDVTRVGRDSRCVSEDIQASNPLLLNSDESSGRYERISAKEPGRRESPELLTGTDADSRHRGGANFDGGSQVSESSSDERKDEPGMLQPQQECCPTGKPLEKYSFAANLNSVEMDEKR